MHLDNPDNLSPSKTLRNGNRRGNPANAPRCGARTRAGTPCKAAAVHGKRRCRMHGGLSPGAPKGSKNALKHGHYTTKAIAERKAITALIKQSQKMAREILSDSG